MPRVRLRVKVRVGLGVGLGAFSGAGLGTGLGSGLGSRWARCRLTLGQGGQDSSTTSRLRVVRIRAVRLRVG